MLPPLGAITDPPEVLAQLAQYEPPVPHYTPQDIPSSIDLSDGLPPVRNQVGCSCVGWAVGYYATTHNKYRELGWDLSDANHRFAANYLYNPNLLRDRDLPPPNCEFTTIGADCGMFTSYAYNTLINMGCSTQEVYPSLDTREPITEYHDNCAKPFRISDYGATTERHIWKEVLASGSAITATIIWCANCDDPRPEDNYIIDTPAVKRGSHQVCICGYSDDIEGTGIAGFKFVNSHGIWYGDSGYAWLSEDFLSGHNSYGYWMTCTTTPPYNLRTVSNHLLWNGPEDIIYEVYDKSFNIIDTTLGTIYGPVASGTYGIGAIGGDCMETITVDVCAPPLCGFEVN